MVGGVRAVGEVGGLGPSLGSQGGGGEGQGIGPRTPTFTQVSYKPDDLILEDTLPEGGGSGKVTFPLFSPPPA